MKYQPSDEPLGLVVHSLPNPQDIGQTAPLATGRWKLVAIVVVCSIPVLAAYLAFLLMPAQGRAGLGEFISPARPVGALAGVTLDGVTQPLASLQGRWLLVSVADGGCDAPCQRQLFIQRQLRATLGKDQERVDRVWLVSDAVAVDPVLRAAMGDAVVLRVDPQALRDWLQTPSLHDYLFVVDPFGNAMMRFPAQVDAAQASRMRRDLDHLLRATAAWSVPQR